MQQAAGEPLKNIIHSTVRIECQTNDGISTGTGFFFQFLYNEKERTHIPCIVTNKHVIKGAITGKFYLSPEKTPCVRDLDNHYTYVLNNFKISLLCIQIQILIWLFSLSAIC